MVIDITSSYCILIPKCCDRLIVLIYFPISRISRVLSDLEISDHLRMFLHSMRGKAKRSKPFPPRDAVDDNSTPATPHDQASNIPSSQKVMKCRKGKRVLRSSANGKSGEVGQVASTSRQVAPKLTRKREHAPEPDPLCYPMRTPPKCPKMRMEQMVKLGDRKEYLEERCKHPKGNLPCPTPPACKCRPQGEHFVALHLN